MRKKEESLVVHEHFKMHRESRRSKEKSRQGFDFNQSELARKNTCSNLVVLFFCMYMFYMSRSFLSQSYYTKDTAPFKYIYIYMCVYEKVGDVFLLKRQRPFTAT